LFGLERKMLFNPDFFVDFVEVFAQINPEKPYQSSFCLCLPHTTPTKHPILLHNAALIRVA
jgi:hypothetical protein